MRFVHYQVQTTVVRSASGNAEDAVFYGFSNVGAHPMVCVRWYPLGRTVRILEIFRSSLFVGCTKKIRGAKKSAVHRSSPCDKITFESKALSYLQQYITTVCRGIARIVLSMTSESSVISVVRRDTSNRHPLWTATALKPILLYAAVCGLVSF